MRLIPSIREKDTSLYQTATGVSIEMKEVWLDQVRLIWGSYSLDRPGQMEIRPGKDVVELHFKLTGSSIVHIHTDGSRISMNRDQHGIFYCNTDDTWLVDICPAREKENNFFEANIPRHVFDNLAMDESRFLESFSAGMHRSDMLWPGYCLSITPQIRTIIRQMATHDYTGKMKALYLESKLIELFLLQVKGYDNHLLRRQAPDRDCIYAAKEYLDHYFDEYSSIIDLARRVGTNQQKLKKGFRELFGNTVFGYVTDLKMERARTYLLDEKMPVGTVSALTGYKNQQHFAAAFKKKFGVLPSRLSA